MHVTKDIKYIGVNDHKSDLFEGQYKVPNGMSYNSYVIDDAKIAVLDTVDIAFKDEWLNNLESVLSGRTPDYLIVHHMEPDHSACIADFATRYPEAIIVSGAKSFDLMAQFYSNDYLGNRLVVKDGDILHLGKHSLKFIAAPMVHWPEVMMSYDITDGILFSADAFGKFGALDVNDDWVPEARRYYFGIVGKYGLPVQNVLKKALSLDIKTICPLHGPVLTTSIEKYLSLYNKWSSYTPEEDGIVIAYSSVYGNTEKAVYELVKMLHSSRYAKVTCIDLAHTDMSEAVSYAFRYSKLVLASITYNAGVFPHMREFINALTERAYQNRTVALIENGSWAPTAVTVMRKMLEGSKNIRVLPTTVTVKSALDSNSLSALKHLALELTKSN